MVIVPMTFLFVLLVILIAKAPKGGVWVVGSLVFLAPLLLYRLAMTGALSHAEAIPLVVVPVTFLFVLLVVLLAKAPKAGVGLIVTIIVMVVLSWFLWPLASRRLAVRDQVTKTYATSQSWDDRAAGTSVTDNVAVVKEPAVPVPSEPPAPAAPSPIWAPGIEQEFPADIYPSRLAAIRAMGSRVDKSIRKVSADVNSPSQVVIFQQECDRALIAELKNAVQRSSPDATCTIEAELRNLQPKEAGITVRFADMDTQSSPWTSSMGALQVKMASGRVEVNVFSVTGQVAASSRFVEKPWLEDFATFASTGPNQRFIVARSRGTCTSETEARKQARDDALARLTEVFGKPGRVPLRRVTLADVDQGGFIVDQFVQSFEGSVGKVWRQAMLLDVSGSKLSHLFERKFNESAEARMSWARMGFSAIGVIVLIGVIYFFLNMATMGYYEWSLRIAGIVLAIVAVISVLMVVR
jgi:hypothetical protein